MIATGVSDLDINRHIRQALVRYWIDLGRLSIRTAGGAVMLRGLLQKVPGATGDLNSSTVGVLFADIKRIQGVKRVNSEFTNWTNTGEGWQPGGGGAASDKIGQTSSNDGGTWSMASEKHA